MQNRRPSTTLIWGPLPYLPSPCRQQMKHAIGRGHSLLLLVMLFDYCYGIALPTFCFVKHQSEPGYCHVSGVTI